MDNDGDLERIYLFWGMPLIWLFALAFRKMIEKCEANEYSSILPGKIKTNELLLAENVNTVYVQLL